MSAASAKPEFIEAFRTFMEQTIERDARFGRAVRDDRPDGSVLASRFEILPRLWLELVLRPAIPQLRAGLVTDDRWLNEELEEAIEETGDSMAEFVELGFDEAGLDWPEPVVEHYRDQGKYFCFASALELESLGHLDRQEIRDKVRRMLLGYFAAFENRIRRLRAAAQRA